MIVFYQPRLDLPAVEIGHVVLRHGRLYPSHRVQDIVRAHLRAGREPAAFVDRYRSWSNGYTLSREVPDPDWRGMDYQRMFDAFVEARALDGGHTQVSGIGADGPVSHQRDQVRLAAVSAGAPQVRRP